jgi:hypothetical protein
MMTRKIKAAGLPPESGRGLRFRCVPFGLAQGKRNDGWGDSTRCTCIKVKGLINSGGDDSEFGRTQEENVYCRGIDWQEE